MKRKTQAGGYTIVEVMIFLVITGVLLASALLIFNGRRQRTEFTQGVREIEAQLRTIINETASGYYPNSGNVICTAANGSGPQLSIGTGTQQGANTGCIYLGRVMQFTTGDEYAAYTVVGQQRDRNGQEVSELGTWQDQARQTLITPPEGSSDIPDATARYVMPWGITVDKIVAPGGQQIGAFSFMNSLGSYSGTDLASGSTSLNLIPLLTTTLGTDLSSNVNALIDATENMASDPVNPGSIVVCLRSGGGDRQAAIIIGGNNSNTSTEVVIDNVPEACSNE